MAQTATIQIKIDPQTKTSVTQLFESMGLTLADAIKLFLKQSLNSNRLPFEILPPDNFFSEEDWADIAKSIKNAKQGNVKKISNQVELEQYLESL